MPDEFTVHISRDELHAIEIPASFETSGSFDVVLVNHGTSLHVHLHLDDSLSEVAALDANNHYVEGDSSRVVRIGVDTERLPDSGVFGRLKIVSAYGSQTRWVDIELTPSNRNAAIYMQAPSGSPFPEFRYAHARDGPGTVVEISDFGAQAEGTLPLEFAYDPWVDDPTLGFDAAFSLSTGGLVSDEIRCEASRDIPVPAET